MSLPALQTTSVLFRRILSHFPPDISLAFAYGSGVFRQSGNSQGLMQIIKYGVISTDAFVEDLFHWKTMYIAGRLHKPVQILVQNENGKLQASLVGNLKSALTAAFLMLPESCTEEDLYVQIAGLSYLGDFRMIIGEDRSKVLNIVKPNMPHFQKLYSAILQECPQVVYKPQQGKLEVDKSPEGQFTQLMALPKTLQQQVRQLVDPPGKNRDVEETLLQVAQDPDCGLIVQQGISTIVKSSSLTQSAKGIVTAGMKKSLSYSMKKLHKMWKGWRRKSS
ncbi:phosphatidate cytidylyltransferase, mitochondrial isoform X3 [Latimeria chalumnae]|uniref:phosphatidate cytidylyltransferase, mitochondrial isoform X3 n=1 Tax=Latimeria chalumnae TaxID=7897 RepID=UPI0006D91882|nr:PREDICTED: phosphatidate cytidylyltransferase, mitochondrial isoform X3 [Latimeria chalumnae]|eukprot:XP_014351076.1 PREDICTED: phosphatidate cytidylyltransferase, mitochondrial isoform X3 [Latimeria chalumnae]